MALGSLPPWLQINPSQYLAAVEAGTNAGQAIANASQRAWEENQRMQMQQQQQAIENAAQRLAAERLDAYRQAELKNSQDRLGIEQQRLGSMDIAQQRADEIARHNMAIEQEKANTLSRGAQPITHPEFPGYVFLKNPSGAEIPIVRPPHPKNPLDSARFQLSALNAMAPKGSEDPTSADYQTRTNAVGKILQSLSGVAPQIEPAPSDPKQRKANTAYRTPKGIYTWTGSGWSANTGTIPLTPTAALTADQTEPDDAE